MGVVTHGNSPRCALPEKQAHADVLRCLKSLVLEQPFEVTLNWVAAHQDDRKRWSQLSIEDKINVRVDTLAKKSLITGVVEQECIESVLSL